MLASIEEWANAGWNQTDVAQALGLSVWKLRTYLAGHPEFQWPRNKSIAQCRHRSEQKPVEQGRLIHETWFATVPRYTVRGVTGTRNELANHFGVVSARTVRHRMAHGWELEAALITPPLPSKGRPRKGHPWVTS